MALFSFANRTYDNPYLTDVFQPLTVSGQQGEILDFFRKTGRASGSFASISKELLTDDIAVQINNFSQPCPYTIERMEEAIMRMSPVRQWILAEVGFRTGKEVCNSPMPDLSLTELDITPLITPTDLFAEPAMPVDLYDTIRTSPSHDLDAWTAEEMMTALSVLTVYRLKNILTQDKHAYDNFERSSTWHLVVLYNYLTVRLLQLHYCIDLLLDDDSSEEEY